MLSVDDKLSVQDGIRLGRKGTINKPQYLKAPFWTVDTLFYLTSKKNNSLLFQYYITQSINWLKYDESTGVPSLSKKTIESISTYIPGYDEQDKNGAFFKKLDKLITLHQRKINILNEQRKDYYFNLFPKKGLDIPKLRFKNYKEEWDIKELGDYVTFINDRAYKQEELLDQGKYRVLRVGNFNTNNIWYFSNLELDDRKYANYGDMLYLWATNFGPKIWNQEKVIYHYHIWKLDIDETQINKIYLYSWLEFDKERIKQSTNGTTMVHITKSNMEKRDFMLPTMDEQIKVGNIFKSIDNLISYHQKKLDSLYAMKKTYLNKLFI